MTKYKTTVWDMPLCAWLKRLSEFYHDRGYLLFLTAGSTLITYLMYSSLQQKNSHTRYITCTKLTVKVLHIDPRNKPNFSSWLQYLPAVFSGWYSSWGRRKHVSTCSPVSSSRSVWNFSMGWAWFSDSHTAFRFKLVNENGRYCSLKNWIAEQLP
jgi:hypothetical protein